MTVAFPALAVRSLGVGLDVPWGSPQGFCTDDEGNDAPSQSLAGFLANHTHDMGHVFVSWQPRSRATLDPDDYVHAWDALMQAIPANATRALHHTALNLAHSNRYKRDALFAFTNALIERYDLAWVNEDLGYWSLDGKPLPYPLPPMLTDDGLAVAIDNVAECQDRLRVPLLVEFPGFSREWSLRLGPWDAYDFFREVVEQTNSPCTLDTGHLLSWRWLQRHRGRALLGELDRLPLDNTFEVHVSGAAVVNDAFHDTHDGVILDLQVELLERLIERCPNLQAVTFEDPRLQVDGTPEDSSTHSVGRIRAACSGWLA